MTDMQERFFLLIGATWRNDIATDKLRASGVPYKLKRFDSGPHNWESILGLITDPGLIGAVCRLNPYTYGLISSPQYEDVAERLFRALGSVAHVVFVHEAILIGEYPESVDENEEFDDFENTGGYSVSEDLRWLFTPPPENIREAVGKLLERCKINVMPYRTNAEMSVLSSAFIDDHEKNLLFRVYVPSGRLYAAEADKLISLFQEWLNRVGRHNVRQGGYRTGAGEVYEFFGDPALASGQLSREFNDFSNFLDLCVEDPMAAEGSLSNAGIDRISASSMVMRYGKEVRRLHLDLRQQREARMLTIRHSLEAELVETANESLIPRIDDLIEEMVPGARETAPMDLLALRAPELPAASATSVVINQQVFHSVQGAVVQSIQGTVNLSPEAKDLLQLVSRYGGQDSVTLESAVHELEDQQAQVSDRLVARQRLKGFLLQLGGKIEDTALAVLQNYVQSKMGL